MLSAKAFWTVRAQLIPGEAPGPRDPAKRWTYTSEDHEADCKLQGQRFNSQSVFRKCQQEAQAFAQQLQDDGWNVVTLEYCWI